MKLLRNIFKTIVSFNTEYEKGISVIINSPYFSKDVLTKKELISLRSWENGMRDTPFKYDGKKYKNYLVKDGA